MAVTNIAHKPELTAEQAMEIFERHFAGKYEVAPYRRWGVRRDFWVKKNGFVGVAVKLEQRELETKFVYVGYFPSILAMLAVLVSVLAIVGFIGLLLCYLLWNGLTGEIRSFIESAPEFN